MQHEKNWQNPIIYYYFLLSCFLFVGFCSFEDLCPLLAVLLRFLFPILNWSLKLMRMLLCALILWNDLAGELLIGTVLTSMPPSSVVIAPTNPSLSLLSDSLVSSVIKLSSSFSVDKPKQHLSEMPCNRTHFIYTAQKRQVLFGLA